MMGDLNINITFNYLEMMWMI